MSQFVLKSNGQVVPRRTLRPLKPEEVWSVKKQKLSDQFVAKRWDTSINPPANPHEFNDTMWEEYEDDKESPQIMPEIEDMVDSAGRPIHQKPLYENLLNRKVEMQNWTYSF
jgi:hypothetical protein